MSEPATGAQAAQRRLTEQQDAELEVLRAQLLVTASCATTP